MSKEALRELLAKVEEGEVEGAFDIWFERGIYPISKTMAPVYWAGEAYGGNLNSAKLLHDAILTGWSVEDMSQNGRVAGHPWGIRLEKWDARVGGPVRSASAGWGYDSTPDNNPARAWLIAMIKALIAEGE